jgi:sterol desaturase/sphingolipid hydroxylase (fatty acid hydroxylase superfamily)
MKSIPKEVRIFENPWLESISRVHPLIPLVFWSPIILWFAWRSQGTLARYPLRSALIVASGLTFWTLIEYCAHRWLFHAAPQGKFGKRLIYILHGNHHEAPNDLYRLLMPILPAALISGGIYLAFSLVFGLYTDLFFASFLLGYLSYDYSHLLIHWRKPQTQIGIWIKQHHMAHHFKSPHLQFGVSSPFWDYFFNTVRSKNSLPD